MWRILTSCSRFLKQHKITAPSDTFGQITPTQTKFEDDSIQLTTPTQTTTIYKQKNVATTITTNHRLNYYKFDYYDYLCTTLGINSSSSINKFGYKDKVKMPNLCHHENSKTIVNDEERKKVEKIQSNKKSENTKLDNLFNELKILNEQSVGKLENMIALTMISELKYDEAIPYLVTAAQNGYQKAQYNLGLCYQDGLGVDKDEKIAFYYFKMAAENNHPNAAYNCAVYYLKYDENIEMGIKYLRISVKNDNEMDCAKKMLAILLISQEEYYQEAFYLLLNLKETDKECEYYLGFLYENGYGVEKDWNKALEYYEKSIRNGNDEAKIRYINLKSKKVLHKIPTNRKLGHFTHSIGQFDKNQDNIHQCRSQMNKTNNILTNALKQSNSSSQLTNLLLLNNNENKFMNDHKNSNNLIYVN